MRTWNIIIEFILVVDWFSLSWHCTHRWGSRAEEITYLPRFLRRGIPTSTGGRFFLFNRYISEGMSTLTNTLPMFAGVPEGRVGGKWVPTFHTVKKPIVRPAVRVLDLRRRGLATRRRRYGGVASKEKEKDVGEQSWSTSRPVLGKDGRPESDTSPVLFGWV